MDRWVLFQRCQSCNGFYCSAEDGDGDGQGELPAYLIGKMEESGMCGDRLILPYGFLLSVLVYCKQVTLRVQLRHD